MDKKLVLYDGPKIQDFSTFNTSIDVRNLDTGEIIFKGLKNKVVIAGSGMIAHSLFDIASLEVTPSYNNKITGLYTPNIEDPLQSPISSTSATHDHPKVLLFCCGIDGCGTENSQVYPVNYSNWISPENLIPFRCMATSNDSVDRNTYFGRATVGGFNYYYFKTFATSPKLVQQYSDGEAINDSVYDIGARSAETYVELTLRITKDDLREYFNISSGNLDSARINSISLCSAYPIEDDGFIYYKDIRPVTRLNFPNESLIDPTKGIEIVYHIYM